MSTNQLLRPFLGNMLLSGLNMFELNRIGLQQAEICVFSVPIWGSAAALNEAEIAGKKLGVIRFNVCYLICIIHNPSF